MVLARKNFKDKIFLDAMLIAKLEFVCMQDSIRIVNHATMLATGIPVLVDLYMIGQNRIHPEGYSDGRAPR